VRPPTPRRPPRRRRGPRPRPAAGRARQGTLDCLLCRADGARGARAALRNLHGALRSPGSLVVVTHSAPTERLGLLRCCEWAAIQARPSHCATRGTARRPPRPCVRVRAGRSSGKRTRTQTRHPLSPWQAKAVFPPTLADLAAGRTAPAAVQDWAEGRDEEPALADAAPCFYVYICRKGY
jgi:hypothetical protein